MAHAAASYRPRLRRPKGAPHSVEHDRIVTSRKDKVSEALSAGAALVTLCVLGLLAASTTGPQAGPSAVSPAIPAALAEAAPPPSLVTLTGFSSAAVPRRAQTGAGCSNAPRQIRFEVIESDPQTDLVLVPRQQVCLAVYRTGY
jgi:hypothetical protein